MAVLRRPEPRRAKNRARPNPLGEYTLRQNAAREIAAHARAALYAHNRAIAEAERRRRADHFLADVLAGVPPRAEDRAAWVAIDREEEFWDLFGAAHVDQANLPV